MRVLIPTCLVRQDLPALRMLQVQIAHQSAGRMARQSPRLHLLCLWQSGCRRSLVSRVSLVSLLALLGNDSFRQLKNDENRGLARMRTHHASLNFSPYQLWASYSATALKKQKIPISCSLPLVLLREALFLQKWFE